MRNLTVYQDYISLLDTLLLEHRRKDLHLIEQLFVRDALLGVGNRAVVQDGGRVAVAGEDMTVYAVVAC